MTAIYDGWKHSGNSKRDPADIYMDNRLRWLRTHPDDNAEGSCADNGYAPEYIYKEVREEVFAK